MHRLSPPFPAPAPVPPRPGPPRFPGLPVAVDSGLLQVPRWSRAPAPSKSPGGRGLRPPPGLQVAADPSPPPGPQVVAGSAPPGPQVAVDSGLPQVSRWLQTPAPPQVPRSPGGRGLRLPQVLRSLLVPEAWGRAGGRPAGRSLRSGLRRGGLRISSDGAELSPSAPHAAGFRGGPTGGPGRSLGRGRDAPPGSGDGDGPSKPAAAPPPPGPRHLRRVSKPARPRSRPGSEGGAQRRGAGGLGVQGPAAVAPPPRPGPSEPPTHPPRGASIADPGRPGRQVRLVPSGSGRRLWGEPGGGSGAAGAPPAAALSGLTLRPTRRRFSSFPGRAQTSPGDGGGDVGGRGARGGVASPPALSASAGRSASAASLQAAPERAGDMGSLAAQLLRHQVRVQVQGVQVQGAQAAGGAEGAGDPRSAAGEPVSSHRGLLRFPRAAHAGCTAHNPSHEDLKWVTPNFQTLVKEAKPEKASEGRAAELLPAPSTVALGQVRQGGPRGGGEPETTAGSCAGLGGKSDLPQGRNYSLRGPICPRTPPPPRRPRSLSEQGGLGGGPGAPTAEGRETSRVGAPWVTGRGPPAGHANPPRGPPSPPQALQAPRAHLRPPQGPGARPAQPSRCPDFHGDPRPVPGTPRPREPPSPRSPGRAGAGDSEAHLRSGSGSGSSLPLRPCLAPPSRAACPAGSRPPRPRMRPELAALGAPSPASRARGLPAGRRGGAGPGGGRGRGSRGGRAGPYPGAREQARRSARGAGRLPRVPRRPAEEGPRLRPGPAPSLRARGDGGRGSTSDVLRPSEPGEQMED
ncbi:collagen alpha-1(I) chain-like [Vulpes lagopus]|uniref:collagen alpha-1(I) chain-like n=1 Tax=Vulpes lagopus TaxID=494514 RepID=UPI001BC97D0A|nr:collagen alpha-1(I) chain-like [Vulpes lagopus]